jgi:putative addiction module component (TIGR02574 family)
VSIDDIEVEIRKLPLGERAALAKRIVESLDELSESEVEALWSEEAERQLAELEKGLVAEIPVDEVLRRARTALS